VDNKEPITKLEIDKSRRKLTFADCEPGEEIEAVMAENEEKEADEASNRAVKNILDRVYTPNQLSNIIDATFFPLGTPGSVLGIHLNNGYAKKPKNREERIEMKSSMSQVGGRALRSKK